MTILLYVLGWYLIGVAGSLTLTILDNVCGGGYWDRIDGKDVAIIVASSILGPFTFLGSLVFILVFLSFLITEKMEGKTFYLTGRKLK